MVKILLKNMDSAVINNIHINKNSIDLEIKAILSNNTVTDPEQFNYWLIKAITLIDLTTLSGDDTRSNVLRLCSVAASPISNELHQKFGLKDVKITTAAVCVYPNRVPDAHDAIKQMGLLEHINIASVATGFPSGLYPLPSRLLEIKTALSHGATEIDIVLDRSLVLMGKWDELFNEVKLMKEACHNAHMKVILGVGELGSLENVYIASMISMMAGADFIKTSTGKEAVNATLPIGLVMCRAIRRYYQMTGKKIGLKPAGGIKTAEDAVNWLILVRTVLGPEWLSPKLFRIGASSLLDVIVKQLQN